MMERHDPQASVWNTIEVFSIGDSVDEVEAAGGKVFRAKKTIPGVGYQAYCQDTEGNVFGVHQVDPSAL
jgi:predicted enzyme related to lactoylglutathione lyase